DSPRRAGFKFLDEKLKLVACPQVFTGVNVKRIGGLVDGGVRGGRPLAARFGNVRAKTDVMIADFDGKGAEIKRRRTERIRGLSKLGDKRFLPGGDSGDVI